MFSIFLLKTQVRLWNPCPDLSANHSLQLDSVNIKTDSKKVTDVAEK